MSRHCSLRKSKNGLTHNIYNDNNNKGNVKTRYRVSNKKTTMKKLFLTTLLVIATVFAYAQTVQKTYHFGTPMVSEMNGYDVIRFADTYNNGIHGEAALPYQNVSLLLPQNTEAQCITVEYNDFVELEGTYNLMPQQKARPLSSTEPLVFEKNEGFYRSENVYPELTHSKVNTQYLNGCSFAFAQFTPVRYIPATGKVSYAQSVTVTIDVTASKSDKSKLLWMTPETEKRVERLAQNPEAVKAYKTRGRSVSGYELLVVTPQQWVPYFDEYVEFYEARGLRTHVTALEDILDSFEGRDNAEKVYNYAKQEYEDNGIMMLLLGGDTGLVPWRALYCFAQEGYEDNLPADMYFGCFDTNWDEDNDGVWGEVGEDDLLPEVGVGRMPFNNETQFNNMMHKTLEYQANPVLGEFNTVILGAEHLGDGYYGSTDLERLIGGSSDYDYTTVGIPEDYYFQKVYETATKPWTGKWFKDEINATGGQYVHHVGHANTDYVAGWYVNTTNDASFAQLDGVHHNYNFFHSHGCICGDFTHTCILERMVNISTGFVATTGNSRYGWYVPWGDGMAAHLHREFVDAYYNDRLPYIGTAFVEMKIMTAPYVTTSWGDEGCLRWNLYDLNILGDVAVCPWLDEPFRPEVSYASALALGTTATTISVKKDGVPQSNFRCSVFHNDELLAAGLTNDNGDADLVFAGGLDVADSLTLIITGPNAWPQTISVIGLNDNEAYVYPQDIDIHGDFEYGQPISMDVDFKNAGLVDANNVTATLTTASEFITLSKSTVDVGTVAAGQSITIADAFDVVVADNIPDGTYVCFDMVCTDGTNVWNREVFFIAKAPKLIVNGITYEEINGDGNGFLDPGELFRITATVINKGHKSANNVSVNGSVDNALIDFTLNNVQIGDIAVDGIFAASVEMSISPDIPEGTPISLNMRATSGQYMAEKSIDLCVGTVMESFETGDLTHLDWQLDGDAEWFVTDAQAHTGSYSAQCGNILKNQKTSLIIEINTMTDGEITFYYKTSTKYKRDYLIFYLDGKVKDYWSGENDWTMATFAISAGYHTLEWRYDTAANGATEGNVCWIDDITFPGNTMVLDDIDEIVSIENMTVYPNPATDVIYLNGADIQYVEIYNSIGKKVVSKNVVNTESISVAEFASGLYFVRSYDNNGKVSTTKFIKK